ncbi:hypothetical protein HHK36_025490 [Tetracentron sinense]|uniref:SUI1 domain-containing protein n=1 Tax=Tetracentron sinense TaxID=13715 RepID=A0A834YIV4_TETSI|nr:hypothetical protein HHK36_025490 [Tetracentron sinense]
MAEKLNPVRVLYCSVCSLPAEYCEFGPDFEKCKPWLIENAPELYPDLVKEANGKEADKVSEQLKSVGISSGGGDAPVPAAPSGGASTSKQEEIKRLPGGKIKKKDKQEVVIEKVVRNKRKCITIVKGLELFDDSLTQIVRNNVSGVKLSDASKKLGKKFATGASVVKGPTEKEQIDVQGDISYDIVEFITDTWPDVPETAIYFIEDGRKVLIACIAFVPGIQLICIATLNFVSRHSLGSTKVPEEMAIKPTVALRAIFVGGIAAFAKVAGVMKAAGSVKVGAAAAAMTAAASAAISGSKREPNDASKPPSQ